MLQANDLEQSFQMFSELANSLGTAYNELQGQVTELTNKLESVSRERLRELTEKERLAKRLQELLSILPTAVIVIDGNGIVQECNPAAAQLLSSPLVGIPWCTIIEQAFSPRVDDGHEVSLVDGRRVSICIRSRGDEAGQIIVLNDLSETRALQEQLNHDKNLKMMGKMMASLAHQIRTPLAAAILYASNLRDNYLDNDKKDKFSKKLVSRLNNIERQIRDMLIVARGGQLKFSYLSLDDFLNDLEQLSQETIRRHNAQLMLINNIGPCKVNVNLDTLQGAVGNLINNAIEASPTGVSIKIIATLHSSNVLELNIIDNGPGMSAATLAKATEPFFTTRSYGTGLGLDVVRAVVEAHQGSLAINSDPGKGTTISILLPCIIEDDNRKSKQL